MFAGSHYRLTLVPLLNSNRCYKPNRHLANRKDRIVIRYYITTVVHDNTGLAKVFWHTSVH